MTIFKKTVFILFFLGFISPIFSQNELNDYKYIVVPKKYDFLKKENQYLVNSYVRHLFKEEGYQVYYLGDPYPEDLEANICLGINAMVVDKSSMLTTKLVIAMVDCKGQTVFESIEGKSKYKDFNKTFRDALNKCFVSIAALDYKYEPSDSSASDTKVAKETSKGVSPAVPVAAATVAAPVAADEKAKPVESATDPVKESPAIIENEEVSTAVVAAPIVVEKPEESQSEVAEETVPVVEDAPIVAKSYQNDNITFILINQGAQFQAFITKSNNDKYQAGEMVGTFEKTSLPNVFRVSWKKPEKDVDETTAYFDDKGNLKIDIHRNGKLEVVTFTEVK